MTSGDLNSIVPAISLLMVITGWFVNSMLNRRHEISKRRTELRLKALESFVEISKKLNFKQSEFCADEMLDVQIKILMYGYPDEIKLINSLVASFNENEMDVASNQLNELTKLVRVRLRKEIGLPKVA
ncbi:hypothetical protein LL266_15655 [Vibrio anguillarum]|uniref:hypothetical protein n=1 Tax=Vibrio anguillarum TaxID=55601 RepID=UPI001D189A0D|nr:hypothetical protein [Vibrio anguillarum]MCC4237931.1 hypothetical protein [Vibrio anguillarum]